MKKSLLALAVLGAFAGTAMAQSSVTIYGIVDMGVAKANDGTAPSPGVDPTMGDSWALQQSANSRLGFRGNEDLGGGLSAQFQIEHRFRPDTGNPTNPNVFWHGRSYVQLTSTSFGSVYLGREYSPTFWPAVKSDPFGWNGVGQMGGRMMAGFSSNSGVRMANTVGYKTPKFGGLSANVAVGASETSGFGRDQGFNVEYGAGPLYAALGYEAVTDGANDDNNLVNLAVHYDFGFVKPMFYYARAEVDNGDSKNDFVSLGATAPLGTGKLKAMVYRFDPENDEKETKFAIGYDYPLSKRTLVYVDASSAKKDGNFDNTTAFNVGVMHTF